MTLTREYYHKLISILKEICLLKNDDPEYFSQLKKDLLSIIKNVKNFNLFPLTFTEDFWDTLNSKTYSSFLSDKLILINELHFELYECLHTTRFRYGGELLFYLYEIRLAILNLPIDELKVFNENIKIPEHYYLNDLLIFNNEDEKKERIKKYKASQKSSVIKKQKVSISKKYYDSIEEHLKKDLQFYQNYIGLNFPSLSTQFSFFRKNIRAYLTQAMSNEIFEFRIHSYDNSGKNTSISLVKKYFDFYPAYFYNLEEISERQTAAIVTSLKKSEYVNIFTRDFIFQELISIFLSNANESVVGEFTKFLLKCQLYQILKVSNDEISKFDFLAEKENKKFAFEIYHHKSRSLDKISDKIEQIKPLLNNYSVIFVFSSFPGDLIIKTLKQNKIKVLFISELIDKIKKIENDNIIEWYIKENIITIQNDNVLSKKFEGETLIKRLQDCPTGDKFWSEYEEIGIDIFRFLFEDSFKTYLTEKQVENSKKNHRRDLVVSNYYKDSSSFWAEIKQHYNAKAIIVDFKNYAEKLNSTTLFSVSKYTTKNVGNFAIVFSRKGIDKTAVIEQQSLYQHNKLILEFNDIDLNEMILEKINGNDPLDRLKSKEFEIVIS